jgi:hypothetical protein
MRVYIGPYRNRITWPIKLQGFYFDKRFGKFALYGEKDYKKIDFVVENVTDYLQDLVNKYINEPWLDKNTRKIKVKLHHYDTWNADNTLAIIIHPLLVKLKSDKQGIPLIDDEDVPENIRSTNATPKEDPYDIDEHSEARWNYVLDEMIWAFEQCAKDDTGDTEYLMDSENPERMKAHYARISNGHRLFGKYYFSLWT